MSLKDALLKAGLKSSKVENERQRKYNKDKTKVEKHQEKRNYCEVCFGTYPDVEKFNHKKPTLDARWICCNCADKEEIHDQFRVTHQSDFALKGRYRRQYGPTEVFEGKANYSVKSGKQSRPKVQKTEAKPRYTIDENGDKNFNC